MMYKKGEGGELLPLLYRRQIMKKITAAVMGFGDRGQIYASYAKKAPEKLEIVACIDPDPVRLQKAKKMYGLREENCFADPAEFYAKDKLCDAVINATMDELHVKTTLPLLEKGYDVLLEKPITSDEAELLQLQRAAQKSGRVLMICHVLRYAPFYVRIKHILESGELGRVVNIFCSENVYIPHMLSSYVRGKWSSERGCGSGMLMAKCCHDLDMIVWLTGGMKAEEVSSFGARSVFCSANKPKNAGTRCLVDCAAEPDCPYSARKLYLKNDCFPFLVWANVPGKDWNEVGPAEREELLKTVNPHGTCAYEDKDLVDHQSVMVLFRGGVTATLNMTGGTSRPGREIHIVCERGEIEGFLESNSFVVRRYDADLAACREERIDITEDTSGAHSGGDLRLAADFVARVAGEKPSISCTSIDDSIAGHMLVIGAERARREHTVIKFDSNGKFLV